MAALTSDIALAMRRAIVVTDQDAALLARFPNARDGRKAPATGYFDDRTDAASALAVRRVLIGTVRRRFTARVQDEVEPDLDAGLPAWRLVDVEQGVDQVALVGRIEIDEETETTSMELFG